MTDPSHTQSVSRLRRVVWATLAGVLLIGASAVAFRVLKTGTPPTARPADGARTKSPARESRVAISHWTTDIVGDAICAECHADITAAYANSGMSRSWQSVPAEMPAHFDRNDVVADSPGIYRYQVGVDREGRPMQEETLAIEDNAVPYRLQKSAKYLVGSGKHAQTLVAETNGYLHQLPLAWFASERRWQLNPGYEFQNLRFGRPIAPACVGCHATQVPHRPPTRNRYQMPIKSGIGCERCHGGGRAHVAKWRQQHPQTTEADSIDRTIINPARLSAKRANDICLQCHLQGDVSLPVHANGQPELRPGDRLSDNRIDYLIRTSRETSFGVASHGARMLQSECYRQSSRFTCFTCHDPHRSVSDVAPGYFDKQCASCHQPETCSREGLAADKTEVKGCVGCHMQRRPTREGIHLVFTDHWIQRKPQKLDAQRILQPNDNVTLVLAGTENENDPGRLGSAYVLLHETYSPQNKALSRGVDLLSRLEQSGSLSSDQLYWLASGCLSQRRSRQAVRWFERYLATRPNDSKARYRLGVAYSQLKLYEQAAEAYREAINGATDWLDPYEPLVRLEMYFGHNQEAKQLLSHNLKLFPTAEAYANLALVESLLGQSFEASIDLTDKALAIDPRHVRTQLVRAQLFSAAGRRVEAVAAYRAVLAIDPSNSAARAALRRDDGD